MKTITNLRPPEPPHAIVRLNNGVYLSEKGNRLTKVTQEAQTAEP